MKILHTSDWHVGKVLKGQSRYEEHKAVLAELMEIARDERPDLVLVAGDLYDTAAPSPEAVRLVVRALTSLRRSAGAVVVVGGNHDNGAALDALQPWAESAGITLRGSVRGSAQDHIVNGETSQGERWQVVALPFLSQRYAVRAVEMYDLTAAEATQTYADHLGRLIGKLSEGFDEPDRVHLLTAHLTVVGGAVGGGEREAHTIMGYAVPSTVFPGNAHYVALGHLHRAQQVPGPCHIRYSGSPLAVDFGEEENVPSVSIVDVSATTAPRVREVPITAAARLRTVRGTLEQLAGIEAPDGWLRAIVREQPRAGLREEVQDLLPRALEVHSYPELMPAPGSATRTAQRAGRSPGQLFGDYLDSKGHADDGVRELFHELLAEVES